MWNKFILWLFGPVIDEVRLTLLESVKASSLLSVALTKIIQQKSEDAKAQLECLQSKNKADTVRAMLELEKTMDSKLAGTTKQIASWFIELENNVRRDPALTPNTLRTWEAVSYATRKWERDSGDGADRKHEIICWTRIYLHENQWTDPGDDVLETFIDMRQRFDAGVKVKVNG